MFTKVFDALNFRELINLLSWGPKNSHLPLIFKKCEKMDFFLRSLQLASPYW